MDDCSKILLFLSHAREELGIESHRKVFTKRPLVPEKLHLLRVEHQVMGALLQRMPQTSLHVHIGNDSEASDAMIAFQWVLTCEGRDFTLEGETNQSRVQQYLRSELLRRKMDEANPGIYSARLKPVSELSKITEDPWVDQGIERIVSRVFSGPDLEASTPKVASVSVARRRI